MPVLTSHPTVDDSQEFNSGAKTTVPPLVGQWKRFGPFGPRYEVLSIRDDTHAMIKVHTSGEITEYKISSILEDPVD